MDNTHVLNVELNSTIILNVELNSTHVLNVELNSSHVLNVELNTKGKLRGRFFQTLLLVTILSCINANGYFAKKTRPMLLAILFYEQVIHITQISLRPSIQLLSNRQHAHQYSF